MKKILLLFTVLMFSCSVSFAGSNDTKSIDIPEFAIDVIGKTIRVVSVSACSVVGTISKIIPQGKVVYGVCKGVELTSDVIEYFCQDAVDSQECKTDTIAAISVGTAIGVAVGVGGAVYWLFSDDEGE